MLDIWIKDKNIKGDGENFTAQQASIISCLSLIGGFDSRPRIGGLVDSADAASGTVCSINHHGKILIQQVKVSTSR